MFLEIRHLQSLWMVEQQGNLSLAASRLHLTQSALSHQIKALERYFDTPLYLRNTKPLKLTDAGRRVLQAAEKVLPIMEAVEADIKRLAAGDSGRLHIAIECHACYEWLLPVLERFRARHPQVEVDIRLGVSFDAMTALVKGEVDLVISSDLLQRDDVVFHELFDYEARLIIAGEHPLAAKNHVEASDLAPETLITYPVSRRRLDVFKYFLQPAGIEPAQWRQVELTAVILLLVASGRGVAVLPDWVINAFPSKRQWCSLGLGAGGMHGKLYAALRQVDDHKAYVRDFVAMASGAAT